MVEQSRPFLYYHTNFQPNRPPRNRIFAETAKVNIAKLRNGPVDSDLAEKIDLEKFQNREPFDALRHPDQAALRARPAVIGSEEVSHFLRTSVEIMQRLSVTAVTVTPQSGHKEPEKKSYHKH